MSELFLTLPDNSRLRAVRSHDGDYPCIQIFLDVGELSELICFAEYNPEKDTPMQVCVGVYQSHLEDTTYYKPYHGGIDNEFV
ncbi:MAG: hypothetical protein HFE92_03645 [Acutalibacter muris]|nr:hypothetical protein [Acutalibacter muris]